MLSKKTLKKIFISIAIILVVLWFGGNLGLHLFFKSMLKPDIEKAIDYIPEKLKLAKADIKTEPIHLMGLKLKFPFHKEKIKYINPLFLNHQIGSIGIHLKDKGSAILFGASPIDQRLPNFFEEMRYSRLKDFSWWNIPKNIRLIQLLTLKAISIPAFDDFKIYDLETPYLKGFLTEGITKNEKKSIFSFDFARKNKQYTITFIGINEISSYKVRDILATIEISDNIEESYKEMQNLYKNKQKSKYPEVLLMLSMISLKGSTIDNLSDLIKIMEHKNYESNIINRIKKEREFLQKPIPSSPQPNSARY